MIVLVAIREEIETAIGIQTEICATIASGNAAEAIVLSEKHR